MALLSRLSEDMKTAMKSGQKDRLSVLRMLINEVKNAAFAPKPVTEEQAVESYAKRLRKSVEEYEKLGKPDEAARIKSEIAVAEEFLPKKASPQETEILVEEFLARNTFTEKQIGQAMGAFMKAHGGQVGAAVANQAIRKKLGGG